MFGKVKTDEQIDKMYEIINDKYLIQPIDRFTVDKIIKRIAEITDIYYDTITFINKNDKTRHTFENSCLCYRILNNESCPEASTTNTVLSFLTAVYHFVDGFYGINSRKLRPEELIKDFSYLSLCAVFNYDYRDKFKNYWLINDGTLHDVINKFFDITDEQITEYIEIFDEFIKRH